MATIGKDTTITWLGHGTFLITTPEGKRALIDAWVDTNPSCPESLKVAVNAGLDVIFLTHGHFDHVADIASLAKNTGAKIACQYDLAPWLESKGVAGDTIIGFNKGGTIEVAGIRATMTNALHSSTINEQGTIVPLGSPAGFVLRMSNGFTIYHTGDTCVTYDMQIIGELYKPDLTILPIGDWFTMDPRQAAYALKLIRSAYAIGEHWGTFPILSGTPELLADACKEFGVTTQVLPLRPGDSVS